MSFISEMPAHEQHMADESPRLMEFGKAMGASRFTRMMAMYFLRDELAEAPKEAHDAIYFSYAKKASTSVEALKPDVRWAKKINQEDLMSVFEAVQVRGVSDMEWTERITLSHLRAVGKAVAPDGGPMTSKRRTELLNEAYHAGMTGADFEDYLRRDGYLAPKKTKKKFTAEDGAREEEVVMRGRDAIGFLTRALSGDYGPFVQTKLQQSWERRSEVIIPAAGPDSACTAMLLMAEALRLHGIDVDLGDVLGRRGTDGIKVAKFLRYVADAVERKHPGVTVDLATSPSAKVSDEHSPDHPVHLADASASAWEGIAS